jgi:hypothetical protein
MDGLASAVVEQLRAEDGPAKHWLLCCIREGRWEGVGDDTFYAGLVPETKDGKKRYVVEICNQRLIYRAYKADSRHAFATAMDAATFLCAHAQGVQGGDVGYGDAGDDHCCSLKMGVVDPEQTTKLFEEGIPHSERIKIPALRDAQTMRASCRRPAQLAAMLEAVAKQL